MRTALWLLALLSACEGSVPGAMDLSASSEDLAFEIPDLSYFACLAYVFCLAECKKGDAACAADCEAMAPAGAKALLQEYLDCVAQQCGHTIDGGAACSPSEVAAIEDPAMLNQTFSELCNACVSGVAEVGGSCRAEVSRCNGQ